MSMLINPYAYGGAAPPPDDPSTIASIWDWWEPSREGLANNDPISTLTGQVSPGAGHNFTQTLTARPTFIDSVVNGLGVARFDGSNDFMGSVNPSALTAAHLWMVIKVVVQNHVSGTWDFGTSASQNHYALPADSKIYDGSCSNTRRDCGVPAADLTQWQVPEVVSTSSEWTYKVSGTQLFTTGTNTVGIKTDCHIGQDNTNERACDIAGVYLFSAKLSAGERTTMVAYLNDRFGLSIS